MNIVNLIGNLARDTELKYTTGENPLAVCKFTLAVNEGYGDKKRTDFLNIVVFGKQAESCDKFLSKGRKAAVSGRIQTGSYEKDGVKHKTFDIIADRVEFIGGGDQKEQPKEAPAQIEGFQAVEDNDIPF